ncbi:BNR-4 repeat-containing protein [Opitutus terrae]|uniref:Glycosyl hydrolase family 88 n=1 Tax=Opitutus terrae (strain DSM 11246 / JCM 15787 / PB90-1) TaxID=452637 RepID=B1ZRY5_OPITP|nr:BNR-4 repeat-containing protein [Opitutus terrae]ACB74661.1 glycosyl hydrolase family 88 [Opitutus terrae PB90-1]
MPLRPLLTPFRLAACFLASSGLAAAATAPIARVLPIAPAAYAGSSVNVVANTRSAIVTHSTLQYAAFYDADGFLVLAQRPLGADVWTTQRTPHRANVADAHNSISLAVDGAGFLHVAWDHHNSPLHYARVVTSGTIDLGEPTAMTGEREQHVTYPQFHLLPNGDLLFTYRDGESGNGALVLNRYITTTRKWSVVQPNLIDGEGQRSPYADLTVDRQGTLHLAWIWRDSPNVASNHDLAYAQSKDAGVTWTRTDGTPLALPITAATAEYALRIPTHHNLMNPPSIDTDGAGRPFLCSYWSETPESAPRFAIVRFDGTAWKIIPGPAREQTFQLAGGGTKHPPISRALFLVDTTWDRPGLHLIYRDDARDGHIMLATSPGHNGGEWSIRELYSEPVGGWEPSVDPVNWRRLTQVHLLVQSVEQRDGNDAQAAAAATPIASLIWAPAIARMRSEQAAGPAAAATGDQAPDHPGDARVTSDNRAIDPTAARALAQRVADWQWAHFPPAERHHPRDWVIAPFYLGVLALDRISPDHHNREKMLQQAEAIGWQPHARIYHADDHCVIQAYLELYPHYREPRMMEPSKQRLDQILANPSTALFDWGTPACTEHWSWCDALFMAPVAWLQVWQETKDPRYLDFMNREWWLTTRRLYGASVGFYFRDESYLDLREPNGKAIHWSRGNGWVFAGLARVLDLFPKDHPDYPRYVQLYRDMARAVLAAQQPDGLWRVGLLDPAAHTVRETSGSSFFTFGLAWGVNRGLLDRAEAEPAVRRAWNALTNCVTPEGKLEHVQPIGAAPEGFDPHHTNVFAVGAFLLAASEVYPLSGGK